MPMWTFSLEGGPSRVNHAAVAIGDMIFSFGGYCSGEDFHITRPIDIHVFDTIRLSWQKVNVSNEVVPDVPYHRYGHSVVAVGPHIYLWGGRNDVEGACNVVYCYHTAHATWQQPRVSGCIPVGRDGHSACIIDKDMLIYGGYEEENDTFSSEIFSLNLESFVWSHIYISGMNLAPWRDFHTANVVGNRMYVFGGRSDEGGDIFTRREIYNNDICIFDTEMRRWFCPSATGPLPIGRRSHSAFLYDGELYVFGGFNGRENKHYNTLHAFDTLRLSWREVCVSGQRPCPRRRQCCCLIGSKVFIFGGTGPVTCGESNVEPVAAGDDDLNLLDHSDLHILDLAPSLRTLCMRAVLSYSLDITSLPRILELELSSIANNPVRSRSDNSHG